MNVFIKSIASVGAVVALALAALPVAATAGEVYNRASRQEARGVASGQLTRREYRRIDGRLDAIDAQRRRDLRKNDGHLTPGERAQLNRERNRNSTNIYFDKHNRADQPGV